MVHLQEEEFLCDLLDELLWNVFREKLGSELELQWIVFLDVLLGHLQKNPQL